eukprot:486545_1
MSDEKEDDRKLLCHGYIRQIVKSKKLLPKEIAKIIQKYLEIYFEWNTDHCSTGCEIYDNLTAKINNSSHFEFCVAKNILSADLCSKAEWEVTILDTKDICFAFGYVNYPPPLTQSMPLDHKYQFLDGESAYSVQIEHDHRNFFFTIYISL